MRAPDAETRSLQHPHLHGDIGDVLGLHAYAGLHLVEVPLGRPDPNEDVGAHEHAAVLDGRLEDRRRGVGQQAASHLERLRGPGVVLGDQDTAREPLASEGADRMPRVEDVLLRLGDRIGQLRRVGLEPQRPAALQPGLEPRLGQPARHHCHLHPTAV